MMREPLALFAKKLDTTGVIEADDSMRTVQRAGSWCLPPAAAQRGLLSVRAECLVAEAVAF